MGSKKASSQKEIGKTKYTPIMEICLNNYTESAFNNISILIENGEDPTYIADDGWNALFLVLRYNKTKTAVPIVRLLLSKGCDPNIKFGTSLKNSLLMLVRYNDSEYICEIGKSLIEYGVNLEEKCSKSNDAVYYISSHNYNKSGTELLHLIFKNKKERETYVSI